MNLAVAVLTLLPLITAPTHSLVWTACPTKQEPTAQCTRVTVPIDREHPEAGTAQIAVARLPAKDPAHRIGSLLVNPGGPGGSGAGFARVGGLDQPGTESLYERFDVVGFDPRGVPESTPRITCSPEKLYDTGLNRFPSTRAEYAAFVEHNRAAGEDCLAKTGPMLGHVDTKSAAEDVDAIRSALGEQRISWFGLSYGTELGAVYASSHPGRVDRMVLDGAVDHARPIRQAMIEEAAATEDALLRFSSWCHGSSECALHGQDVLARYDDLASHGAYAKALGRKATGDELASGAYGFLYLRSNWPELGRALAAKDASELAQNSQYATPTYGAYRSIGCQDFPAPFTGVADMRTTAALVRTVAPHSWRYTEYWDLSAGCTGWPLPARNPPQAHPVHGAPPILVVGGAHDPATPLPWARGLAASIDGSSLLTRLDDGHTGLYNSPCAVAAEVDYLVSGVTPGRGAVCR
ncbi:alpha/beta hydrolase family protein [Amycolatopsis sulphurea]|uniref:Alpha/beta hydrolase family protein n=1 Tax=Amycolatopsis sulphurea TaxID=76022 RepID=A0A2A9FDB4_9PSEU|nr:alpha/beta hydrolase family protein [Amycolatopsis sulphurea]